MDDEQGPWWTRPPEPGPQARTGEQWRDHPYTEALDQDAPDDDRAADPWVPTQARSIEATTQFFEPVTRPAPAPPEPVAQPEPEPEPEPEPAPPPLPQRPVIRRVAVVPPAPPARTADPHHDHDPGYGRPHEHGYGGNDPTETLPAVGGGDGIFAVFGGPDAARPGPGSAPGPRPGEDPLAHLREDAEHPHRRLPPLPHVAPGRLPLILAAGGLVIVLVVLVILIGPLSRSSTPSTASRTATAGASKGPVAPLSGTPPSSLTQVSSAQAAQLLRKAGQHPGGTIVEAWGWTDRNGQNLVVTSMERKNGKEDLRVTHVAQLNGDDPKVLRIMRDPGLPAGCKSGTAGFTPGGTSVRDLNNDGVAEIAVGWSSRCGGASSKSVVKLALITNGDKYIIRGDGVLGHAGDGTTDPAPRASSWPKTYLAQLTAIFRKLYY